VSTDKQGDVMPKYWVYINDYRRFEVEADSPEEAEEIHISGGKIIEDLDFGYAEPRGEKNRRVILWKNSGANVVAKDLWP